MVQVEPMKLMWKAPGTIRLKLKYDKLLSSFAFKFDLHRFNTGCWAASAITRAMVATSPLTADRASGGTTTLTVNEFFRAFDDREYNEKHKIGMLKAGRVLRTSTLPTL